MFHYTSHSAYAATETELYAAKIDGLKILLAKKKKTLLKFLKKKTFFKIITEGGRWRNFSLTFSGSTKNLVVIIHRS